MGKCGYLFRGAAFDAARQNAAVLLFSTEGEVKAEAAYPHFQVMRESDWMRKEAKPLLILQTHRRLEDRTD